MKLKCYICRKEFGRKENVKSIEVTHGTSDGLECGKVDNYILCENCFAKIIRNYSYEPCRHGYFNDITNCNALESSLLCDIDGELCNAVKK